MTVDELRPALRRLLTSRDPRTIAATSWAMKRAASSRSARSYIGASRLKLVELAPIPAGTGRGRGRTPDAGGVRLAPVAGAREAPGVPGGRGLAPPPPPGPRPGAGATPP